ncbi:hypothetical protein SRHO_G00212920 [Serrasalmus rhombeus]
MGSFVCHAEAALLSSLSWSFLVRLEAAENGVEGESVLFKLRPALNKQCGFGECGRINGACGGLMIMVEIKGGNFSPRRRSTLQTEQQTQYRAALSFDLLCVHNTAGLTRFGLVSVLGLFPAALGSSSAWSWTNSRFAKRERRREEQPVPWPLAFNCH